METVGAYEAKTHLPRLLAKVAQGESISITKHGIPVATLQPPESARKRPTAEVITALENFSRQHSLEGISIRELIEEGRR